MELFEARDHFIIQNGEYALWANRFDGSLSARTGSDICTAWNPICLGKVEGVIGKMRIHPESEWKLLLIRQRTLVGTLPGDIEVYRINKISILPLCLDEPKDLDLELCPKHHFGISQPKQINKLPEQQQKAFQKTWNSIKSAAENVKPKKKKQPPSGGVQTKKQPVSREVKEKEKSERRVLEEVCKMLNDSESFYYCPGGDLTNTIQRQYELRDCSGAPAWRRADSRFFWNHWMLQDLINDGSPLADHWIVPVIQGYVQIELCTMDFDDDSSSQESLGNKSSPKDPKDVIEYKISIISRRSRNRAGTRYKRRGVDTDGHCANYVETEQIVEFSHHTVSFVQVRGSVPVYWSQTGIKYKPPPRIEKGEKENHEAFVAHCTREVGQYGRVAIVNLVDQIGKEKNLADAYLHHVVSYNDENLVYIAFDFHEYCRGMRFENVSVLIDNIKDVIKDIRYCWVDKKGLICAQAGVFRVNCVDCLDRTNVVQSAIARVILETQCRKLGLLPPDEELSVKFRFLYQQMWANNGDAISRQYAGTAALKGDFTRTGERKFTGLMKDGVNSANRYYRNQFKDIYRQATIDLMLGVSNSEELAMVINAGSAVGRGGDGDEDDFVLVEKEENMKTLIDEWKKMLIIEPEACLGGWGLIDCDPTSGDPTQQDMDMILLLSQRAYYIANYDDEIDTVTSYQKIQLDQLEKIEIGPAPSIFKSRHVCLRIWYRHDGESGFFHMFRTTNTRLFNNIVIAIKNEEEARESLRAVCESFNAALKLMEREDVAIIDTKLERKKSKPHCNVINVASQVQTSTWSRWSPLSRDTSSLSSTGGDKSPFDRIKPPPGLNIAKLGRTFAGLNPMNKVKFSRLRAPRMPGFVPAVWYSKQDKDSDSEEEKKNSLERARILKGDHIVSGEEVYKDGPDGKFITVEHNYNIEDIDDDLNEDDMDRAGQIDLCATDTDVILSSCGILATSSSQVLSSLLKDRHRTNSDDALLFGRRTGSGADNKEITGSRIDHDREPRHGAQDTAGLAGPAKPCSVDLINKRRKRHHSSADLYEKKRAGATVPPIEEIINEMAKEDIRKTGANQPPGSAARPPGRSSTDGPKKLFSLPPVLKEENHEMNGSSESLPTSNQQGSGAQVMDTMTGVNSGVSSDTDVFKSSQEQAPATSIEDDTERPRHPKIQMIHPSMKLSFSDTSLSTTFHEMEHLDVDLKQSEASGLSSPFSKLRVKMSNLAIPNIVSGQSKRSQALHMAMENKYLSELRFKECKTRIILL